MIKYCEDSLFNCKCEAVINTVNTVGIMGKGIALQFKKKYPKMFVDYKNYCNQDKLKIGTLFVWENPNPPPDYIVNFPTKKDWQNNSEYEYIEKGLIALKIWLTEKEIKSIGIPPLGCGNGNLDWKIVEKMILEFEKTIPNINLLIFAPKIILKK